MGKRFWPLPSVLSCDYAVLPCLPDVLPFHKAPHRLSKTIQPAAGHFLQLSWQISPHWNTNGVLNYVISFSASQIQWFSGIKSGLKKLAQPVLTKQNLHRKLFQLWKVYHKHLLKWENRSLKHSYHGRILPTHNHRKHEKFLPSTAAKMKNWGQKPHPPRKNLTLRRS